MGVCGAMIMPVLYMCGTETSTTSAAAFSAVHTAAQDSLYVFDARTRRAKSFAERDVYIRPGKNVLCSADCSCVVWCLPHLRASTVRCILKIRDRVMNE